MVTKTDMREAAWTALRDAGAARFPGTRFRIPNFVGAERAAERLAELPEWQAARCIKANPDSPQLPVRRLALAQGKTVYMAVPKLAEARCFIELDPAVLGDRCRDAASIQGSARHGRPVRPEEMRQIDLIVTGCVAVRGDGGRLGKGGGYSDLEYAVAREVGLVSAETPIVTTVHAVQVTQRAFPMLENDISLTAFATPEALVRCDNRFEPPAGVDWSLLTEERIRAMPVLAERVDDD